MNKKFGMYSSLVNLVMVIFFAVTMLFGASMIFWSYLSSILIAWSFVVMMCAFAFYAEAEKKIAGFCAAALGVMYAICNSFVYFTQITTVHNGALTEQVARLLDFGQYGLMFNYDMLGYCFMALSTFFAGFTVLQKTKSDKWLKSLLSIHGIFAVPCFIMPMLGFFSEDMAGGDMMGTVALLFWCIYFAPVGYCHINILKANKVGAYGD